MDDQVTTFYPVFVYAGIVVLLVVAMLTAGLTAFYAFRAYFLTFSGELRTPPEAGAHVHEAPRVPDPAVMERFDFRFDAILPRETAVFFQLIAVVDAI